MKSIIFLVGLFYFSSSVAQQHQNGNMYLLYDLAPGKYYNIDQEITPQKLGAGTFWALQFGFNEIQDGGYIGIQTNFGDTKNGLFIFSIWNATEAVEGSAGSYTTNFDGEGSGKSCRLSIPLIASHIYKLRIWQLESNSSGTFWGAWITDKSIDKEYYLGKIKVMLILFL